MSFPDFKPIELRDYATSYGWTLVKEAIKEDMFVLNSPENDLRQLVFPINSERDDFVELANLSIYKLAGSLQKSTFQIREEIREVNDDVISVRYYSDSKIVNSISFEEALGAIEATRQMLLSAASTVVNPKVFHPKLNRTEPQGLIKKTRFRHTEEGSFILKISCPIEIEESSVAGLFGQSYEKPFSRKTFEVVNESSRLILNAIQEGDLDQFSSGQLESDKPIVSYNLCDSMVDLFDDDRELPFELRFDWSRAHRKTLIPPQTPTSYKFPYDFKPKIEQLKSYFRPSIKELNDTFFGTVEELKGDEAGNVGRSGEVILALLVGSEKITARVNLNAEHYKEAIKAHGSPGTYIKINGRLYPGKRIRLLDSINSFELVSK